MESEQAALGIAELAEQAGVTPRTIRYYVAEGLLPPPAGSGQQRAYGRQHLLRLKAIRRLKDAYLPLEEIRRRLAGLAPVDLEQLATTPAVPPPTSALDYLAAVLPAAADRGLQLSHATALPAQSAPPLPATPAAPAHPEPVQGTPPRASAPPAPGAADQAAGPVPAMADGSSSSAPAGPPRGLQPLPAASTPAMSTAGRAAERAGEESPPPEVPWHRVTLAPGVELQYQRSGNVQRDATIARLIDQAMALLSSLPPANDSHR
jgi:DNA-binding transcriptional MerR regulator